VRRLLARRVLVASLAVGAALVPTAAYADHAGDPQCGHVPYYDPVPTTC
jgi:hypothetical protein